MIDLSSCFLECIPFITQNLRKIVLNDNCITENISCLQLKKMYVKDNLLNKLPDSFQSLTELQSVDFSSTNLDKIPWQILNFGTVRNLKMRNNVIEKLPDDWNQCVNIRHLDLSQNPLMSIPSSVAQLQKLQILKLESCCLSEFPVVLLKLQALEDLDLRHNFLSSLPDNTDQLHLKRPNIQHNLLQNLPETLVAHSRLQYLYMSSCRFQEWPQVVLRLRTLKHLFLGSNSISAIPTEVKSSDILTLSLKDNPLGKLDDSLNR